MTTNASPIIGKVCKSASYTVNARGNSDLTCVKITNIHEDGSRSNSFVQYKDFEQPYYLVKPEHRKFEQHKDYIEASKCRKYKAPRCKIAVDITKFLYGKHNPDANIREVSNSPYVFGLDQTPPVHIKQYYFKRFREFQEKEPYTMAAYDVETDMDHKGEDKPIMMASVTFGSKAYFAGVRGWYHAKQKKIDPTVILDDEKILANLKEAEDLYLSESLKRRNCTVEYELFDTPGQVAEACIKKWHEWEPDWVTSWNATYDMEANERALKDDNYHLGRVYCDPSIPREFQNYRLDKGRTHKTKEDGSKSPLDPQEKFPSIRTMAKWQWADAMSFFAIKRASSTGKLDTYTLEGIANYLGVPGKLYTKEGAHLIPGSPQWHRFMQRYHPYLYSMYNIGDNFVIEEINELESDFSLGLPMLLKYSEYFNYVSQPKTISDTLSFIALEHGYVWGSTPSRRDDRFQKRLPTLKNWIALLDTEKNADVGKAMFNGLFDVLSNGRTDSADIDVEGAYPHGTLCNNVSNKTTQIEVWEIQGASPDKFREIAVNYASSPTANAIGLCNALFKFPEADKLKEEFERLLIEDGKEDLVIQLNTKREDRVKLNQEFKEAA